MKRLIAGIVIAVAPMLAAASGDIVNFRVTVKKDGQTIESPSFLANVGQAATVRLGSGITIEALAKPDEPDGKAWTQIRITYFETDDSKFVQEMQMRHSNGLRTGSFDYTDPTNRRYHVEISEVKAKSALR